MAKAKVRDVQIKAWEREQKARLAAKERETKARRALKARLAAKERAREARATAKTGGGGVNSTPGNRMVGALRNPPVLSQSTKKLLILLQAADPDREVPASAKTQLRPPRDPASTKLQLTPTVIQSLRALRVLESVKDRHQFYIAAIQEGTYLLTPTKRSRQMGDVGIRVTSEDLSRQYQLSFDVKSNPRVTTVKPKAKKKVKPRTKAKIQRSAKATREPTGKSRVTLWTGRAR